MTYPPSFLAALTVDLPKHKQSFGKVPSLILSDVLVIVGVGLALLVVLAGGIYVAMRWRRKRRRHVSGGEKVYRGSHGQARESAALDREFDGGEAEEEEDEQEHSDSPESHQSRRRYKYRVRRRTHRTRNPTLSEAGGLPPVKTQEPGKSC